jgi:ParB-like chromosome segregation protein Spo0J
MTNDTRLPQLTITPLATKALKPSPTNAKVHPQHQIDQIATSIETFGFNDPIAVDCDNTIIEGHGRWLAAKQLNLKTVPVIHLGHLTPAQQAAYVLAHNKLCLNTGFDLDLLRIAFTELTDLGFDDLSLTGFGEGEIEMLFTTPSIPDTEPELDVDIVGERDASTKTITCPHCGEEFNV